MMENASKERMPHITGEPQKRKRRTLKASIMKDPYHEIIMGERQVKSRSLALQTSQSVTATGQAQMPIMLPEVKVGMDPRVTHQKKKTTPSKKRGKRTQNNSGQDELQTAESLSEAQPPRKKRCTSVAQAKTVPRRCEPSNGEQNPTYGPLLDVDGGITARYNSVETNDDEHDSPDNCGIDSRYDSSIIQFIGGKYWIPNACYRFASRGIRLMSGARNQKYSVIAGSLVSTVNILNRHVLETRA